MGVRVALIPNVLKVVESEVRTKSRVPRLGVRGIHRLHGSPRGSTGSRRGWRRTSHSSPRLSLACRSSGHFSLVDSRT